MSLLPEITQLVAKIEGEMADILEQEGSSEESRGYKEEWWLYILIVLMA